MSVADDYRAIVARLRSWGFAISETSGCYSRSNGLGWARGVPVGHVNHHYVCSLNPAQSYINSLVNGLMNGKTVTWFADVNGAGYLIGAGPMNHAGTGNSSVLARTVADQAPPGPSTVAGDMTGNTWYSGTELQHPGDSTPYPQPMVDLMVAISAAEAMQWGWPAARIINHYEWTGRKIDMSVWGGRSDGTAGRRMRAAVAARMDDDPINPPLIITDWIEELMASVTEEQKALLLAGAQASVDVKTQLIDNGLLQEIMNRTLVIMMDGKDDLNVDRFNEVLTDVVGRAFIIQDHVDKLADKLVAPKA